ncbi:hypothetical protein IAT40_000570 [Kwoniella sp. CBS 6097]
MSYGPETRPSLLIARKDGQLYVIPISLNHSSSSPSHQPVASNSSSYSGLAGKPANTNCGYEKIIDPSLVLPQALLGGEEAMKPLHWLDPIILASNSISNDATAKSLNQDANKGVEARLWEGWTLIDSFAKGESSKTGLSLSAIGRRVEECEMQVMLSLQAAQGDPKLLEKHYRRAVKWHDYLLQAKMTKSILKIEDSLKIVGSGKIYKSVIEKMVSKYQSHIQSQSQGQNQGQGQGQGQAKGVGTKVDADAPASLRGCVGAAEGWKLKGNDAGKKGKHETAIRYYLEGLIALWPWTSSTVALSFEVAHSSGLSRIEQALFGNIATIALAAPAKTGPKRAAWDDIARTACAVVLQMRYATFGSLYKSFDRLAQLDTRAPLKEEESAQDNGSTAATSTNKVMADLFEHKPSEEWAHRYCLRHHICHE